MFKDCNTSDETHNKLVEIVKRTKLIDIQKSIAEKFYNVDDIVKFIYTSIIAGGNGILHGPGGFGKSQVIKAFFNYFDIQPLIVLGHSGTDIESLLGIPNIKKLTEESIYEIAFENSIFSKPGILIFEEFLDVKPVVASALKDIITEGGYRRGDEFIPSKIGSMFICSNKSPDEVVIDFSTAAFYKERFPYSKYVAWDDYSAKSYLNLFKVVYKDEFEANEKAFRLIAEICSSSCTPDTVISPRISLDAVEIFKVDNDVESLHNISSLNLSKIDEIKSRLRIEDQYKRLNSNFSELIDLVTNEKIDTIEEMVSFIGYSSKMQKEISKFSLEGDDLLETVSKLMSVLSIKTINIQNELEEKGVTNTEILTNIRETYENIQEYLSV